MENLGEHPGFFFCPVGCVWPAPLARLVYNIAIMSSIDALTIEDAAKLAPADVLRKMQTMAGGLGHAEAARRLAAFGPNEYRAQRKLRSLRLLFSKFTNPLILLLLGAAVLSGFLGSPIDAILIVVIVVGSALIDFFNTFKSEQAAHKLQEKVRITASVRRDGEVQERRLAEDRSGRYLHPGRGRHRCPPTAYS